jgi:hypothetical protein
VIEKILRKNKKLHRVGRASVGHLTQMRCPIKKVSGSSQPDLQNPHNPGSAIEILAEGQECPFCRFAKLKKDGNEIVCPICGYGHKPCT